MTTAGKPVGSVAMTPADHRQRRADRDRRVLDALRLGGSAEVIAAALGISPELVRRIAHEARRSGHPAAVPPRSLTGTRSSRSRWSGGVEVIFRPAATAWPKN